MAKKIYIGNILSGFLSGITTALSNLLTGLSAISTDMVTMEGKMDDVITAIGATQASLSIRSGEGYSKTPAFNGKSSSTGTGTTIMFALKSQGNGSFKLRIQMDNTQTGTYKYSLDGGTNYQTLGAVYAADTNKSFDIPISAGDTITIAYTGSVSSSKSVIPANGISVSYDIVDIVEVGPFALV